MVMWGKIKQKRLRSACMRIPQGNFGKMILFFSVLIVGNKCVRKFLVNKKSSTKYKPL